MTTTGQKLGQVQLRGHLRIDQVFAGLADAVEAAVLEQTAKAPDGTLTPASSLAVIAATRASLAQASPQLSIVVMDSVYEAVTAALDGQTLTYDTPSQLFDQYQARQQISRTLQSSQPNILEQAGKLVLGGVALGLPGRLIARQARQYFSPFFSPRRSATGALLRADRQGAVKSWPGRAGMASNSVRVVMLDQTGRLHAATTYRLAKQDDLGLQYNLSYQHREADECSVLRHQDVGYGPGVYPPDEAPSVPRHVRCRCYYSTTPLGPRH